MIYNNVILSVLDILKRESAAGEKKQVFQASYGRKACDFARRRRKNLRFGESRTEPPRGAWGPRGS